MALIDIVAGQALADSAQWPLAASDREPSRRSE
jgi:hypothetical protein